MNDLLMNYTKKKLNELKYISEQPQAYIHLYFKRIRDGLNVTLQNQNKSNTLRHFISIVNDYETECLNASQNQLHNTNTNKTCQAGMSHAIRYISNGKQTSSQDFKHFNELIDSSLFKLKSHLFLNKSILLLKANDSFRMIHLVDEHISQGSVDCYFKTHHQLKGLVTREKIILIELDRRVLSSGKSIQMKLCLENLTELNLQHNKLAKIGDDSFTNLVSLISLNLSYNKVSSIECDAFLGLKNLKHLDLSHNRLISTESSLKKRLKSDSALDVSKLSVWNNRDVLKDMNAFKGLINLVRLDLSENCLTLVNSMDGLESLVCLNF